MESKCSVLLSEKEVIQVRIGRCRYGHSGRYSYLCGDFRCSCRDNIPCIRSYITTLVSHSFNKQIEEHRQSLNVVTEHAKFDLQRKLHDFTLYTAKRHEAYVELYNLLRAAADRVCNLEHQEYLNFAGYGREEFEDYLRREGMKNRRIEELSNEWQSGGIDEVNKALEEHNYVQARTDLNDAADLYRKHYLYLSPSMCDIIGNLLKSLQKLLEECAEWYSSVHSTITLSSKRQDNYTLKVAKLQEGIESIGSKLLEKMRKELSVGYYSEELKPGSPKTGN